MKKIFIFFIIYIHIVFISNGKCKDENCLECSISGQNCFECKKGFINHNKICGIKCKSIVNCQICNIDKTKCIKCRSNCVYNGSICDCTERYVLIIVCIFITVSTVSVVCFCLMSTPHRRNVYYIFSGHIRPYLLYRSIFIRNNLTEEENNEIENKIKEVKIINDFNQNKIKENKNIVKKKCVICKNNDCNLKFNCGCYICFGCEKECIKNNVCLNGHKNISSMMQVSCSICFCNKKEISTFNCPCKAVICKECYLKWRKQNNFCPSCRTPIFSGY